MGEHLLYPFLNVDVKFRYVDRIYVYTDGASRGNPGESASGYYLLDGRQKLVGKNVFYNGTCTNNVAEYKAVISALKRVLDDFGQDIEIVLHSDSNLIINQLAGNYKIKEPALKRLNSEADKLLKKFKNKKLLNVRRENRYISLVDKELNMFLDARPRGQSGL